MGIKFTPGKSPTDVAENLKAMGNRAKNLGPVLEAAAIAIKKLMDDAFSTKASPDGTPWAPNSPATLKHKRGSLGIETGKLKASLYATVTGNTIKYGANTSYAAGFNEGHTRMGSLAHAAYYNHSKREEGTAFRVVTPGRAFMPVFKGGAAKAVITLINKWIVNYIKTGALPS
jgi:phage gpG-like protein